MTTANDAFVVDASVAAKWHLKGEDHDTQAQLLLSRLSQGHTALAAPSQIRYEVPSAITAATLGRRPRLSQQEGRLAIAEFLGLPLVTFEDRALILAAFPLVHQHGIAFYDALYLALAQQLNVPLVTADRRLYQCIQQLPNVVRLGDYATTRRRHHQRNHRRRDRRRHARMHAAPPRRPVKSYTDRPDGPNAASS